MINLKTLINKPKKLSIKFYLRKDIPPIVYKMDGLEHTYYHLYIEFIYRRKVNKCKSRYFQFVSNDSQIYSFIGGFENSSNYGYNIYGVKGSAFTDEMYALINNDTELDLNIRKEIGLLNLLYFEKQHLLYLFKMLFEINEEHFTLSRVSDGYQNSLKFMFDYFDFVIKELLQEKLNSIIPFFPILNSNEKIADLAIKLSQTLSCLDRSHPALEDADIYSIINYILLIDVFITLCQRFLVFEHKNSGSNGMTLPMWFVDQNSIKLKEYIMINYVMFNSLNFSKHEIESEFDIILREVDKRVQKDLIAVFECFK